MAFQKSSVTEVFLNGLAVSYVYDEAIKYDKLEDKWGEYNYGRPDNMTRVETAITAYAEQAVQGSPFPAAIVRKTSNGLEVLDGFQRLHANSLIGSTAFAAYVVECHDKTAQKIRRVANIRINGSAPVDVEWVLSTLVADFMIAGDDSAEDIAHLIGRPVKDVKKEYNRQTMVNRVAKACMAEEKEPPRFTSTVYDCLHEVSQPSDFGAGPRKPVVSFLCNLSEYKLKNGDNKRWIEHVFGIKRVGNKDRAVQFNSKIREFYQDPIIAKKKNGKPLTDSITNINAAITSLHTRVKAYRKLKHAGLADRDVVEHWEDMLAETCRFLRELCSNQIRRDLDPFRYGE